MTTRFSIVRDAVLLLLGAAGVVHQEFFRDESDPGLLMFYAAIFGLTAFLPNGIADGIRASRNIPLEDDDEPEPKPRPRKRKPRAR